MASAALFLSSAATFELGYTIRVSYVLVGIAAVIGVGSVLEGFRQLPFSVACFATCLVLSYAAAAIVGDRDTIPGLARAGEQRAVVYVADLALGLVAVVLVVALWRRLRDARPLIAAFVLAGAFAALYGLYQWPAQHYGWPFSDVNNTLDSSGVTRGSPQGAGIFGWERIRGTFLEPQFLAAFLAMVLPLALGLAFTGPRRTRLFGLVSALLVLLALPLTASAPPIALLFTASLIGLVVFAATRGRLILTTFAVGALAVTVMLGPSALASTRLGEKITGRSAEELAATTVYRTTQWRDSIEIWSQRPILGFGPGQSSIQHTIQSDVPSDDAQSRSLALESAQGLWAAALIETGVVGFSMWSLLLGSIIFAGASATVRRPTPLRIGIFAAATIGIATSQIGGDRLQLAVWLLAGLLLVAARDRDEPNGDQSD